MSEENWEWAERGISPNDKEKKPDVSLGKGKFSHMYYDDLTDILFMYFKKATVQSMSTNYEEELEEFAVWLDPFEFKCMKEYMESFISV